MSPLLALVSALVALPASGAAAPCGPAPAASSIAPSYPACFEVTLDADVTGVGPFEFTWSLPTGETLDGNPAVLDTGLLPSGFHELVLSVANAHGVDTHTVSLIVEPLEFLEPPTFTRDGLAVSAVANTRGATEWRWHWGDGTRTGWLTGCDGYAPTHAYATEDVYTVTVEARSCRAGPLSATGAVDLRGDEPSVLVERFEAVCPTAPFCTFSTDDEVPFLVELAAPASVTALLYDWNGDGFDDEITTAPVTAHRFLSPGFPQPRLTALAGSTAHSVTLAAPLQIIGGEPELLFEDGFESGDLRHWSLP